MSAAPHQTKTTNIPLIRRQEPDALYVTEGFVARMNPGSTQAERESTAPYVAWWPTGALQLFACGESPTMQRLTVTNTMPLPSLQLFTTLPVRSPHPHVNVTFSTPQDLTECMQKRNLFLCVQQIAVQPDLTTNPRARQLALRQEGAFWQEVLTPGSPLRSEIAFVICDGALRWSVCIHHGIQQVPVVFRRVQPVDVPELD
jgi:hypothetical protein